LGVTVLGPTLRHLLLCSEELSRLQSKAAQDLVGAFRADAAPSPVDLIRRYLTESSRLGEPAPDVVAALPFLADKAGAGACLNNHSIVLKLEARGQRALLSGDQQFAEPEVPGLDDSMLTLVETVKQKGPYAFWKTSHHTSYNGVDETVLRAVGARYLAHSGGLNDPTHPDPSVLDLLAGFKPSLTWARTERNGLIHVSLSEQGVNLKVGRGKLNDERRNSKAPVRDLEVRALVSPRGASTAAASSLATRSPEAPAPSRSEPVDAASSAFQTRLLEGGPVEVLTRVSQTGLRVHLSIEVEDVAAQTGAARSSDRGTVAGKEQGASGFRLAQGRALEKLLFVTEPTRLGQKIGAAPVREILNVCRQGGHSVVQLAASSTAEEAAAAVRSSLGNVAGVVILGGFDVVPSGRIQVISSEEIEQLSRLREPFRDLPDRFCVWSDDAYGDQDGDGIAELPISRVPDGGSVAFLRTALDATRPARPGSRAGLYNILRPFAKGVFSLIPGSDTILSSQPTRAKGLPKGAVRRDAVYFMLHGSAEEPDLFDGEFSDDGESFWTEPAFDVSDVEAAPGTVVFCGCCYGALSASPIASQFVPSSAVQPFLPSSSIALRFLAAGANAFVGSTAVHFSPPEETPELVGGRLHQFFWKRVAAGDPPARALYEARKSYVKDIPRLDEAEADLQAGKGTRIVLHAAERKTYQMFSCLGLGW
jgi:hypothetical protein